MKILALNTGSSSIKYTLFDASKEYAILRKGGVERIADQDVYESSLHSCLGELADTKDTKRRVDAIGHRIVHGGQWYRHSVSINEEVMNHLKEAAQFAPLHSHPNIAGIEVAQKLFPNIPHIAVFDTAAHAKMPPKAFLYGLPIEYCEKHQIRRYGFHGINHAYVAEEAAKILHNPLESLKVITCHLGNGCSITAFKNGHSIDNSMGLTPLEGVIMGSRSGDLDPAVVLYLIEHCGMSPQTVSLMLNKNSGLLGLCGKNDMRDILEAVEKGDTSCQVALDAFIYKIKKAIGAFVAALDGVDVIVFTGGIGENSAEIRKRVLSSFSYLGASLEVSQNEKQATVFSTPDSQVTLMTIPANEELAIAQQVHVLLK